MMSLPGVIGGPALQQSLSGLADVTVEKGMLLLTKFGTQNLFSKIVIVLFAGFPFIVFFGTIYHKLTKTPMDVSYQPYSIQYHLLIIQYNVPEHKVPQFQFHIHAE